jgi:hypothetical protein
MFTFEELTDGDKIIKSFAYWLLVERRPLPAKLGSLAYLKNWMSFHYEVEGQVYKLAMLRTDKDLLPKYIRLISPVTLAEKWTPFSLGAELLGEPERKERQEKGSYAAALAVWKPEFLAGAQPGCSTEHARHFAYLLGLACSAAIEAKGRVILIGSPGWSYSGWKDSHFMMNPSTALLMHEAGYLYTDRIAQ